MTADKEHGHSVLAPFHSFMIEGGWRGEGWGGQCCALLECHIKTLLKMLWFCYSKITQNHSVTQTLPAGQFS
jgi:hypothetical protein